jgi:hypothetical protein
MLMKQMPEMLASVEENGKVLNTFLDQQAAGMMKLFCDREDARNSNSEV